MIEMFSNTVFGFFALFVTLRHRMIYVLYVPHVICYYVYYVDAHAFTSLETLKNKAFHMCNKFLTVATEQCLQHV